jgi:hypothetical protein
VPAFERLRQQGKTRFLGLTAIGDTTALHRVIDARAFDSAQMVYICSIHQRPPNCRRIILHRTMDGYSIIRRPPASGWSASASSPVALCLGRLRGIRLRVRPPEPIGSAMSYDADVICAPAPVTPGEGGVCRIGTGYSLPLFHVWRVKDRSTHRSTLFWCLDTVIGLCSLDEALRARGLDDA